LKDSLKKNFFNWAFGCKAFQNQFFFQI
jgi:hypothetical protein